MKIPFITLIASLLMSGGVHGGLDGCDLQTPCIGYTLEYLPDQSCPASPFLPGKELDSNGNPDNDTFCCTETCYYKACFDVDTSRDGCGADTLSHYCEAKPQVEECTTESCRDYPVVGYWMNKKTSFRTAGNCQIIPAGGVALWIVKDADTCITASDPVVDGSVNVIGDATGLSGELVCVPTEGRKDGNCDNVVSAGDSIAISIDSCNSLWLCCCFSCRILIQV